MARQGRAWQREATQRLISDRGRKMSEENNSPPEPTQKESIEKLTEYYLTTTGKEVLARLCANMQYDLMRFLNIKYIEKQEKRNLIKRTQLNVKANLEILAVPKEKWTKPKLVNIDHAEEDWKEKLAGIEKEFKTPQGDTST